MRLFFSVAQGGTMGILSAGLQRGSLQPQPSSWVSSSELFLNAEFQAICPDQNASSKVRVQDETSISQQRDRAAGPPPGPEWGSAAAPQGPDTSSLPASTSAQGQSTS